MSPQWRGVSRGLLLIALGVIFLLFNMGYLSASFWWEAASWWPLMLVLLGVGMLFGRRIPFSLVVVVVLVAVLALSLTGAGRVIHLGGYWAAPGDYRESVNSTRLPDGVVAADVSLNVGGVRLSVAGADVDFLDSRLGYWNSAPRIEGQTRGDHYDLSLVQADHEIPVWGNRHAAQWDLRLTDRLPIALHVQAGAVDAQLDLQKIKLSSLDVKAGAGDLEVTLGKPETKVPVRMDVAASHLTLRLPAGVPLRIGTANVVGSVRGLSDLDLTTSGPQHSTPDFDTAAAGLDIQIHGAVSDIQVERY